MATSNSDGVPPMYFEEPFSLHDMDDRVHKGLLAIGILATMSVVFTSALLSFITWRMISVSSCLWEGLFGELSRSVRLKTL